MAFLAKFTLFLDGFTLAVYAVFEWIYTSCLHSFNGFTPAIFTNFWMDLHSFDFVQKKNTTFIDFWVDLFCFQCFLGGFILTGFTFFGCIYTK